MMPRYIPLAEKRRRDRERAAHTHARRALVAKRPVRPKSKVAAALGEPPPPTGISRIPKTLGLVATPCGGTQWVANRLREAGYHIAHEKMGRDGISCGWYFFNMRAYDFRAYEFAIVCRLIRHPLRVLETLPRFVPGRGHRRQQWIKKLPWELETDPQLFALKWWVHTHEALRNEDAVIRVSHMEEDLPRLVTMLGMVTGRLPSSGPYLAAPKSKEKRWPRMSWGELRELNTDYAERAYALVERFALEIA